MIAAYRLVASMPLLLAADVLRVARGGCLDLAAIVAGSPVRFTI